ncbi:MAG: hypothetical protein Q9199_006540 [Rusavskia elegans]
MNSIKADDQSSDGNSRTRTEYNNIYSPSNGLIAAHYNYKSDNEPLFWSDVTFAIWTGLSRSDGKSPKDLRYVARSEIVNDFTSSIIYAAMALVPKSTRVTSFGPADESFLAILGTPNGAGGVYLLMQHKQVLGLKTVSRVCVGYDGPRRVRPFVVLEVADASSFNVTDPGPKSEICNLSEHAAM